MAQSPEIIKFQDAEKIYIDEQFVEKDEDNLGGMIHIDSENHVYLPLLLSDEIGYFTSILRELWFKAFHQRCNKCMYEWEAKWYEYECPRCGSRDYSNVPSK